MVSSNICGTFLGMLTIVLLAALHLAQDPWTISDERSALDGQRTYLAGVESVEPIINGLGRPENAMLTLTCVEGRRRVVLSWPAYLGIDEVPVEWRAGDGEIQRSTFSVIRGGRTAYLGGRDGDRMMDQIGRSEQVVVRVSGHTRRAEAVFLTPDAAPIVATVREACS